MYPAEIVLPMKKELVDAGFQDLTTIEDVDAAISSEGGVLVIINSVCCCAAGNARPAARLASEHPKVPKLTTVFAGFDKDAVNQASKYMLPYPPSSPCMALFKDGKLVHMIERHNIEGNQATMIADSLKSAFDEYL